MSSEKTFKKGEHLFKDGDKITNLYLIKSGAVTIGLFRNKKVVELAQLGTSQVLGEQALLGASTHTYGAVATTETKVLEVPVDIFRQSIEQSQQPVKVLTKSLNERLKLAMGDVRSYRLEKESSPCPEDQVARVYGSIFHTAKHKGSKDEKTGVVTIDWAMMRHYAQRVFGDSPKRMEQALCVLVKLKLAQFEMGRPPEDPEGPEQIMKVHLNDLATIESFFEFYQYHYFKGGGRSEVLKPEDNTTQLLKDFIKLGETVPLDRHGMVSLEYPKVTEYFKTECGITLLPDHFNRLEQKGIFSKRQTRSEGDVVLQFELKEYKITLSIWRMLKEIEKWNEKGFVDMTEDETKAKKKAGGPTCPACGEGIQAQAKFCSECGHKMAA